MSEPRHITYAKYFQSLGLQIVPLFGPLDGPAGSICRCREGADCASPCKHPVAKYKGQPSKLPNLIQNYAIVLDRFVVVDVDDMATLQSIYDVLGFRLPETYTVKTGRGAHLWFEHTEPLGTRLGAFPKVDLKSGFSYVVGPGSRSINGTVYDPVITAPIAPCPPELVKLCGQTHTHIPMTASLPYESYPTAIPTLLSWCYDITVSQTRNNDLLRLTCRAIRSGLFARKEIMMLGEAARQAGLTEDEVHRTMESAFRSVMSNGC